ALTRIAAPALLAATTLGFACSGSVASGPAGGSSGPTPPGGIQQAGAGPPVAVVRRARARDATLAGERCRGGAPCTCRGPGGAQAESPPPDEAHKRFEIRLGATGGGATLDSPTLGHSTAGADEGCFCIDVLPGTTSDVTFTATEAVKEG